MRLSASAVAAPRGAARCARHCGASARSHAGRHHRLAYPPVERLEPEEQPPYPQQRLRLWAFAAVCLPVRRAARDAQIVDGHDEASRRKPPTKRRRHLTT